MSDQPSIDNRGELIGRLKSKLKETILKAKAAEDARVAAEKERDAIRAEADAAKTRYDDSKLKTENQELKTKVRMIEHRKAFDKLAKDRGAADDALDVIWRESGYQAAKDEIDETTVAAAIDATKVKPGLSRLFGDAQPETPTPTPGPGRGQGQRETKPNGKFQVTRAQMGDPLWCAEHHAERSAAVKAGTLEIVD